MKDDNKDKNLELNNSLDKILETDKRDEVNLKSLSSKIISTKKQQIRRKNLKIKIIITLIGFILLSIIIIDIISKYISKKIITDLEIILSTIYLFLFLFILYKLYKKDKIWINYTEYKNIIKQCDEILNLKKDNIIIDKKNIKTLTKDSYNHFNLSFSFIVFNSVNNILYLVYTNQNNSIIFFNLIKEQKICEIKNCHLNYINIFKHYFDKQNKKDILMSVCCEQNNIKLWDVNKCEYILNLKNINLNGQLKAACFLEDEKLCYNYIVTSNFNPFDITSPIKIFDLHGNNITEIDNSNEDVYYMITYYDEEYCNNYIITGNSGCVISYDFKKRKLYHKYEDNNNKIHRNLTINRYGKKRNLIDSCDDGYLRIWDFHSANLLDKIKISEGRLYGICLWNYKYLFVGVNDRYIKLIDLKNKKIFKISNVFITNISSFQKIKHPLYGECLITQGWFQNQIKMWTNISLY